MNRHSRHVVIAVVIALLLLVIATVAARAQDYSSYTGEQLYMRFCASCHGDKGQGDGPVAAAFRIEVPDLTRIAARRGGEYPEEQIRRIIDGREVLPAHGTRVMPVWGFEFYAQNMDEKDAAARTEAMVNRLTDYVRSLQRGMN